jgi:hypothetical protein
MAEHVKELKAEIERLHWYLLAMTKAWHCGEDDEMDTLIYNVDAHQWADEDGFLPSDASIRRVFVDNDEAHFWAYKHLRRTGR